MVLRSAIAFLVLIAVILRVQNLDLLSFWFDEACSWKISQFPLGETFDAISRDAHPPLYYILCKLWIGALGNSVVAARLFSAIFGVLTILACVWLCRESKQDSNSDMVVTLAVVALVGLNASQIELSREARLYTLGAFLAVVAGCFLLRAVSDRGAVIDWGGFTVAGTLLSFTHYYCLFTVIAFYTFLCQEIALRWKTNRSKSKQLIKKTILSAWIVQLFWIPWWSVFLRQVNRANSQLWMEPFSLTEFSRICAEALGVGTVSNEGDVISFVALGLWGSMCVVSIFSKEVSSRLVGLCAGVPLLLTVLYSITTRSIVGDRYLLFAQTFLLINLALWLRPSKHRHLKFLIVAGVWLWFLSWTIHDIENRKFLAKYPGTKGAVEYLNTHRDENTPVIINSPFVHTICLQYVDIADQVYTISQQDHRANILSGPALRKQDLLTEDFFESRPREIWTIDTIGLFNKNSITDVPLAYELTSEERFAERYHFRMDHIVRKYRLSFVP